MDHGKRGVGYVQFEQGRYGKELEKRHGRGQGEGYPVIHRKSHGNDELDT